MRFFIKWAFIRWLLMLAGLLWFILSLSHPQMAGAQTIITATASSVYGGYGPDNAIDGSYTNRWNTSGVSGPHWLKLEFDVAVTMSAYDLYPHTNSSYWPDDWTLQGSNNDVDWDILDTENGYTDWVYTEARSFQIDAPGSYKFYRLHITAPNSYAVLAEIEFHQVQPTETPTVTPTLEPTATPEGYGLYLGEMVSCSISIPGNPQAPSNVLVQTLDCPITLLDDFTALIVKLDDLGSKASCAASGNGDIVTGTRAYNGVKWIYWYETYNGIYELVQTLEPGAGNTGVQISDYEAGTYYPQFQNEYWEALGGDCQFDMYPVYLGVPPTAQPTSTPLANTCWQPDVGTPTPDWENVPPEYAVCKELCLDQEPTATAAWQITPLGCFELGLTPLVPECIGDEACQTATANPPTPLPTMDLPGCYTPTVTLTPTQSTIDPICFGPPGEREDDPIVLDFGQAIVREGECYKLVPGVDITIPAFLGLWEESVWSVYEWQFCVDWVTIPDMSIAGIDYVNQMIVGAAVLVLLSFLFKL